MSPVTEQRVTGILVVHGVGAQAPGDTVRKLLKGLSLVDGAEVPAADDGGPVETRVAGMPLRLYEVHWADLLQGKATKGTFSAAEFQASAWFPWLNRRRKVNPPGKYSLATTLRWTLLLPVVSLALAFPYYGARLFAQGFDRKAARRLQQEVHDAGELTFFQRTRALANSTATQRTFLEDTIDEYVGDVFNYVNSAGQARFPDGRKIDVPQSVQDAYDTIAERFRRQLLKAAGECDDLQVLAHSLGTVVSYHGLFGLRRGDAAYCGLIGSLTKRRRFDKRFRQQGLSQGAIEQLVCPIGVTGISGKKPAEIAIAVAAELLRMYERSRAPGGSLPANVHPAGN